ncbi:MAG: DNA repair protein RadA [Cytophagaceae bacterium]|jgi:DNA repair protein RadA/Sms|nr:DNA repair protein RadA [Cytophagaceae bacterium]
MSKVKSSFFCQSCGAQSPKWLGKCPHCGEWNTYVEELVSKGDESKTPWRESAKSKRVPAPRKLWEIESSEEKRLVTKDQELNRVLGGGIVPGSLVLIGGEPGIGKSTLMLQLALSLAGSKVLYVSGEESEQQIRMRAERIGISNPDIFILTETGTQNIFKQMELVQPDVLVVDSIQTLQSSFIESGPGSISQVRECTAELMKFAKETNTPVFLIGHITKEGTIAGPKILEHMVDTVLQFEGDRHLSYRILRTTKNRFGSTSELGIYEMLGDGLRQVNNPSEILLSQRDEHLSGISISAMLEGNRPLLIEIQSLVSIATYGTPQRSTTGYDAKRLNMLLAVLEKRGGFRLGAQDVFLNVAGGIKVEDPAVDLAVCTSIISSFEDTVLPGTSCFAGEVGLGGEIRAVNRIEQRISEAEKLGFEEMYVSKFNQKSLQGARYKIKLHFVSRLDEVFSKIL